MSRRRRIVVIAAAILGVIAAAVWASMSTESSDAALDMWWAHTDDPARDAEAVTRMIDEAVGARPGQVVADIGTGAGYFAVRFARVVGPEGRVVAADADPRMIELVERVRASRNLSNLEPRLVERDNPGLEPASVDRIALVNSISFAECEFDPRRYLRALRSALRPGGHLVIFRDERHTSEWTPPYGRRPRCGEPSGERIVELARPWFWPSVVRPIPTEGSRPGVAPGFLLVLAPR